MADKKGSLFSLEAKDGLYVKGTGSSVFSNNLARFQQRLLLEVEFFIYNQYLF